ncbi:myeloid-associated differentiation marker homolog [Colossoma macropomum]|uniref:myeloid-associated differentiation marker homolog n=1 Tax=Colossoma macropomum TaxID=42526 RepID=UPI00186528F6|nr:myeloid-associated differentiation marker homolog [Colossoma macropomum]XP_036417859.1 myeloid-associated differentiation marker homolog [Colossoma macropomum]
MALLYWMRLPALVSSCVTLGLVAHAGGLAGGVGAWCIFCWTFSFIGTLLIFLVETFHLTKYVTEFWVNFPVTFSSYAALLCLFASIIFPHNFIDGQQKYDVHNHLIASEIFSCLATLAYMLEIWVARVESKCYMATARGLLLVCQTYVAGIIFFFISSPVSYTDQAAVRWCMAVYCICFICSAGGIIKIVICNLEEPRWLKHYSLCAAILYFSATIIWPVFKFNSHYPSQIYPSESCQGGVRLCPWGRLVVVSVLTSLNFLLYSFSMCCSSCTSGLENEHQYGGLPDTSTVQVPSPSQQYTSDPGRRLLGDGSRNLRIYQSLNQPNLVMVEPNVIVCNVAFVRQTYLSQ